MSSSVHINNKRKDILILGKGPTKWLNHTLAAESQYSINFKRPGIKLCLSLHYNIGATVSYLWMLQKYINSKQKTLK